MFASGISTGTSLSDHVSSSGLKRPTIAVLIPCFNEETSIAGVIEDFGRVLPEAKIYVYDNNSVDQTIARASSAGAIVRTERLQGKGYVVRRMFADVSADVYVLVDGDNTYDANVAGKMVSRLIDERLDLVNGRRESVETSAYRAGHRFGNWLLSVIVAMIFGNRIEDMLSGLKVFSRRFVKSFPSLATGFEIETELTVHALELVMPIEEMPVKYFERGPGSVSKLNTVRDGLRIASLIINLLRTERPILFFGGIFALLTIPASIMGLGIFLEFRATGLVLRLPTAVLCTGLTLLGCLSLTSGFILHTVTHGRRELKRLAYLAIPPTCTDDK